MPKKSAVLLLSLCAVIALAAAGMLLANTALKNVQRDAVRGGEPIPLPALPAEQTPVPPTPAPRPYAFAQSLKLLCLHERDRSFTQPGGAALDRFYYGDDAYRSADRAARFLQQMQAWADCGMPLDEGLAADSVNTLGLYPTGGDSEQDSIAYDAFIARTDRGHLFISGDTQTGKILRYSQRYAASEAQRDHESVARAFATYLELGEIQLLSSGSPNVLEYYEYLCPLYDIVITVTYSGLLDIEAYPNSLYTRG